MFISPVKLHKILNEVPVALKLPVGLSLIIDNDLDKVYSYYKLA